MPTNDDADDIQILLDQNRQWAMQIEQENPGFFAHSAKQQHPRYLWIGCSDSRVPATQITGLRPGEVLVHRNVANVVLHTDPNCMSVVALAIQRLKVRHVIVCGHYGCAGVRAAMSDENIGVVGDWVSGICALWKQHRDGLEVHDSATQLARMCELSVRQQVVSLCKTEVIEQAWRRGQSLDVHGWIYGIEDGILRELGLRVASLSDLERIEAQ